MAHLSGLLWWLSPPRLCRVTIPFSSLWGPSPFSAGTLPSEMKKEIALLPITVVGVLTLMLSELLLGSFVFSWRIAPICSQIVLWLCLVESEKSSRLPSFCPISIPFNSNRQRFCFCDPSNSLLSDSVVTLLVFSLEHTFSFICNMDRLRIFQIFRFWFLFA